MKYAKAVAAFVAAGITTLLAEGLVPEKYQFYAHVVAVVLTALGVAAAPANATGLSGGYQPRPAPGPKSSRG